MHYFSKFLTMSFEDAIVATREALKRRNFAILAEIDVSDVLRRKLGVGFPPYVILSACSLPLARRAIEADSEVGSVLLCNVVVQEHWDGRVQISIADPVDTIGTSNHIELVWVARQLQSMVRNVVEESAALALFQRAAAKRWLQKGRAHALR